ncbi:MAG: hypothetical protein AAB403_12685 [Planctomycetota bacterium]
MDAQLIDRDREMSAGLARAHARRALDADSEDTRFLHGLAAATEFRRAGAHSILLSDRCAAVGHFREAGQSYCRLSNPYGLLMFACAEYSPSDLVASAKEFGFFERGASDRLQLTYLLLAAAAGGWGRDDFALQHQAISGSRASPIGVLGLPVGAYLDLTHALATGEPDFLVRTLLPFLMAHSTAMTYAMENRHHWRMMAMPFHPAEPDILSVIFMVEAAMRKRGDKLVSGLLGMIPLLPASANLLHNAILEHFGEAH